MRADYEGEGYLFAAGGEVSLAEPEQPRVNELLRLRLQEDDDVSLAPRRRKAKKRKQFYQNKSQAVGLEPAPSRGINARVA